MPSDLLLEPVSRHVWETRYRWVEDGHMSEPSVRASWERVALAASQVEPHHRHDWTERFMAILQNFAFLPGGRILANLGTARTATAFNCFVMGTMEDSVHGIFNTLREAMVTLHAGGGVGVDFSPLRPAGSRAGTSGNVASGPVSFLSVWETASRVLETGNLRHGAMMATLRCDHPDIQAFIHAKQKLGALPHFNLSVLVPDDFMRAVQSDAPWPLVFPLRGQPVPEGAQVTERLWPPGTEPELCLVYKQLSARALWQEITQAAFDGAEPGVLFSDHINARNNLWYCERLTACNPCGELPLPPYGACNLGSINLAQFVENPFGQHPNIDLAAIGRTAAVAARFLDNIHDVAHFPLPAQARAAHASRRIGLGVTGLADALIMLGLRYGSDASIALTEKIMRTIRDAAYRSSVETAREKGAFPQFDAVKYCASHFVLDLPDELRSAIAEHGIRNSHLLAIAPTGSVSLLANNVSSGIEPVFAFEADRRVRTIDGQLMEFATCDYALRQYRARLGEQAPLPPAFVAAEDIGTEAQLQIQAAAQRYVDSAISKTVRLPNAARVDDAAAVFQHAWELGLKGCTLYRGKGVRGAVITRLQARNHQTNEAQHEH
jgi:ribonucleoside-diphosphate reductase alpha chain